MFAIRRGNLDELADWFEGPSRGRGRNAGRANWPRNSRC